MIDFSFNFCFVYVLQSSLIISQGNSFHESLAKEKEDERI